MTEPIRIPLSPIDHMLSDGIIITPEIHAQILAPLEKRIAALEACEQARRSPLGEPSAEMQERMRLEINAQPTAQGDDAMVICPGCSHQFPAISVQHQQEISRLKAQVAALAGLLRDVRVYVSHEKMLGSASAHDDMQRIDAALAAAGEGK